MLFEFSKHIMQDFSQLLTNLPKPHLDEGQIKQVLESALQKFQLVTRSEFDAQAAVLARTRQKVDLLEQQLAAIEAQLASK